MIPETEIFIRLLVAAALGALVGLERERQNQPAGLRTHIILVIGSALAMTLSINLATQYREIAPNGDPARLAAQVLSGIGFLGAGAILRYGTSVKGLTTATSLWTMAVVGLVVGAGHYWIAVITTILLLAVLTILNLLETHWLSAYLVRVITISCDVRPRIKEDITAALNKITKRVRLASVERNLRHARQQLKYTIRVSERDDLNDLESALSSIEGVRSYMIE
ncbi:MAG TPA: MgtC/SapB family protein [Anaerolineaceae bacterium]|nr:MgtC/SapB family protein [Anaerolineaceae bacterium]HQH84662.1 MgtC/SapB family protein [Anaerolineaceae bacterium]